MGWVQIVSTILKYLPELVALIKTLAQKGENAVEEAVIRKRLTAITEAFSNPDRAQAARGLNDAFRT